VEQKSNTTRELTLLLLKATFLPGSQPTAGQALVWVIRGAIVLGVFILIASAVDKTLWEWLGLLVVPAVLAIGGYLFTSSENKKSHDIANKRAETDVQIAEQRRHDDALQDYLNHIGELLLDKNPSLRDSEEGDEVRMLARARTLTMLQGWLGGPGDEERQRSVLQFLYESDLISKNRRVVDLRDANFMGAYLNDINLSAADLSGAWLSDTKLYRAKLSEANLSETTLSGALLSADDNSDAADLTDAEITDEQLAKAKSLKGATMPDGQILKSEDNPAGPTFEEWLKSKGRGEE
jgi:uncharacterized protein YjbI with pentapeptide repeats